nr:PREDICTED: DNA damage-binding protein 2-like [Bemisia tabaci]
MGKPAKAAGSSDKSRTRGQPAKSSSSSRKTSSRSSSSTSKERSSKSVLETKTELEEIKFPKKTYNESFSNIVLYLNQYEKGHISPTNLKRMHQLAVIKDAKTLQVVQLNTIFERRITSLTWHPTLTNILGLASKGGGLMLVNVSQDNWDVIQQYPGIGPGGSILALKFHPTINEVFFTASLDGTVCSRNFKTNECIQYLSTGSYDHWFTSFDLSEETGVMIAGDTKGVISLLSKDGAKVKEAKIHQKSKVNHIEFCPRKSWLFVTASLDRSVKLWDLRQFSENAKPLFTFPHLKPVNSAYFSRTNANYLLTTDQHSELRVFQAPNWDLVNIITHPHRQFQHITPIKATWHPLEDIVVCGRYPDPNLSGHTPGELSTVDFMCPTTGRMLYQLHHPPFTGLLSLNQFNNNASLLATGSGSKAIIWAPKGKQVSAVGKENINKKRKKRNEDEDEEEEEDKEGTSKYFDVQQPSTSHKIRDQEGVNRRCSKTDGKKKARPSDS